MEGEDGVGEVGCEIPFLLVVEAMGAEGGKVEPFVREGGLSEGGGVLVWLCGVCLKAIWYGLGSSTAGGRDATVGERLTEQDLLLLAARLHHLSQLVHGDSLHCFTHAHR